MSLGAGAQDSPENLDISPFLNPEHWAGHSIGIGNPDTRGQRDPGFIAVTAARLKIASAMNGPTEPYPIRRYTIGETFSLAQQPNGTIFTYTKETLSGKTPVEEDEFEGAGFVPARPTDVRLKLTSGEPEKKPGHGEVFDRHIAEDGRVYTASSYFGVVAINGFGVKRFVGFPRGVFYRSGKSGKLAHSRLVAEAEPKEIEVGKVRHILGRRQRLERVNALQVYEEISFGKSKRIRKRTSSNPSLLTPSIEMP